MQIQPRLPTTTNSSALCAPVFHESPVLNHDGHAAECVDIRQWVPGNGNDIGLKTSLNGTYLVAQAHMIGGH